MFLRRVIFALFLVLLTVSCGQDSLSQLKTDLGGKGNDAVKTAFSKYEKEAIGCTAKGNKPRVLLTGFGLFSGSDVNLSGAVLQSMAQDEATASALLGALALPTGAISSPLGADAYQQDMQIEGTTYDVCLLVLSVQWDFAASVILREMQNFQPNLVVMTGIGDENAYLEGASRNDAKSLGGYDRHGQTDEGNIPMQRYVLPPTDPGVKAEITATWNNQNLFAALNPLLAEKNIKLYAPLSSRDGNTYICNNVSHVVFHGARNIPTRLAGENLNFQLHLPHTPRVGFLHLPKTEDFDREALEFWIGILKKIISEEIAQKSGF